MKAQHYKNYFLKWHDGLLNRVEFLLYDTSGKKISEDGGMIGGSICYTHKCKDGYKKVDNNCVATCDGGVEKDTIEATIDECKKNWPEWEGKDAAETCHKECFDSGEWKYVIDTCKAGYERVNAGGVLCKQKEQEAKGGAETTKTPGVATVSSDAAHPVATTPGADAGNPGGAGGNAPLATTPGADAGNPVVTETSDAETPGTGNSATATGNVTPTTADSDAGYVQEVHSDCKDEAKVVKPASGGECPGNANKKVTIKACVKDRHSGDAVEYATVSWVGTKNFSGVIADKDGCFELKNVPGNAMLSIGFVGLFTFTACASDFDKKDFVCMDVDEELDEVMVAACYGDVLRQLNADNGKPRKDENGQPYCDIICPNGFSRHEKIQSLKFTDTTGKTFDSPQKYICVANNGGAVNDVVPHNPDGSSCRPTDENATSGVYQNGECVITGCANAFKLSDDKKSCIYDEKLASQRKIDELQENADAMRDKEHSTANKLLGGAAIGATGIGAMQALSAYSEQQSDEDAETAMKAYLATFHCNYGGGINVKGGEKDVQLPGGNELIGLYAEYVNLANNLKVRKAALDMRPGIESEAILDSATSGLYDDVSIGKTSGAFTSLARALQNPDGPDAQAWAAQKDDSAKKLKTGLTVAGIGAIGGAVGNLLINKDAPKENSKEILDKYKDGYLVSGDDLDLNNGETRSLAEAVQPDAAVLDVKQDKTKSQDSVGVVMNKDD